MLTFKEFLLKEEVAATVSIYTGRDKNTAVTVFKNPSSSDFVNLNKSGLTDGAVRWLAIASGKKFYCWNAALALHDSVMGRLAALKVIKSGLESRNDEVLRGIAKLSGGQLTQSKDLNLEGLSDKIKSNTPLNRAFLPLPFKSREDIINAAPSMVKKFKWVDDYIEGFTESSPWTQILNASKDSTK